MHIETNFEISYQKNDILKRLGNAAKRLTSNPRMEKAFNDVIQEAPKIVQPIAGWDVFPVEGFKHDKVLLKNGVLIGGGPVVEVYAGASEIVLCVCSAGKPFDDHISAYQDPTHKDMLKAVILDSLGSYSVGMVRDQILKRIKKEYETKKYHTSIALSPGESTWEMYDQKIIFNLLNTKALGVSLNDSMLMVPMKSISFTLAAGPNKLGIESGSRCQWCLLKDKCDHNELNHPDISLA